jgi:uncharacterized metal-binding protein YceD (DUF177 family)
VKVDPVTLELDTASLAHGENRGSVEVDMMAVDWDLDEDMVPADEVGVLSLSIMARPMTWVVRGKLEAEFRTICSRCLRAADFPVTEEVYRIYSSDSRLEEEEVVMLSGRDRYLSILDAVREAVILSVPGKPLCVPDCKGLCPVCGCNWNEESCRHRKEPRG